MNLVKQFNFMKDKDLVMKSKGSELPKGSFRDRSVSPHIIIANYHPIYCAIKISSLSHLGL